jgi:hypothetical protein
LLDEGPLIQFEGYFGTPGGGMILDVLRLGIDIISHMCETFNFNDRVVFIYVLVGKRVVNGKGWSEGGYRRR